MSKPGGLTKPPSKSGTGTKAGPKTASKISMTSKRQDEEEMPAFSRILHESKQQKDQKAVEKDKKKHIRRNKPPGEDLEKLKEIMKSIKGQPLNINEFIGLIAPSTGDNGELLLKVLSDELSTFRKLANKIYDTNTQDVSDVLTNEHVQMVQAFEERRSLLEDRLVMTINEIYGYAPNFCFESYYTKLGYLETVFPLPMMKEAVDPDDEEALRRQEAYHRFQWIKAEGKRLTEENSRLQKHLQQLKKQQRERMKAMADKEEYIEEEREKLDAHQEVLEQKLKVLERSVEQALVDQELAEGEVSVVHLGQPRKRSPEGMTTPTAKKEPDRTPTFAETAAADIEAQEVVADTASKVSIASKSSKGAVSKIKKKRVKREPGDFHFSPIKTPSPKKEAPKQASPFHYSPPKSPARQVTAPSALEARATTEVVTTDTQPGLKKIKRKRESFKFTPLPEGPPEPPRAPRETSPFHYSPPKTPPEAGRSSPGQKTGPTEEAAAPEKPMTRYQTTRTVTETFPSTGRSGYKPKDTWGGFG